MQFSPWKGLRPCYKWLLLLWPHPCVKYIQPKRKWNLFICLLLNIKWSLCYNFTQIYFIKFSNEKVLLNTILTSQIKKYLFLTFIIPKFLKFCIQLNINPMESTMVLEWNLNKIWIYFLCFCQKLSHFLLHFKSRTFNCIL